MSSEHLRKYLAYYQKTLREEPENIEARLRLAALFREMGRLSHAVEEYVTASKLLASQGLALEAIAACKAVLEIDPTHTEVQFFLARLFAQLPDAAGSPLGRIARPLAPLAPRAAPSPPAPRPDAHLHTPRLQQLSPQEAAQLSAAGHVITLARPKTAPGLAAVSLPAPAPDPHATRVQHRATEELLFEEDVLIEEVDEPVGELGGEPTSPVEDDPAAEDRAPRQQAVTRSMSYSEAMRDAGGSEDLRSTLAMEPEDVLEELRRLDAIDRSDEQLRRTSAWLHEPSVSWQPSDRSLHRHFDPSLQPAAPMVDETTSPARGSQSAPDEQFTLGVFDMDSVELDSVQVDATRVSAIMDAASDEQLVTQRRLPRIPVNSGMDPRGQRTISIRREELPEIPLLSGLGQQGFVELLNSAALIETGVGEQLLSGVERRRSLFIILRGHVTVSKLVEGQPVQIAAMGQGDFFGEFALLTGRDVPSALVTASAQTTLLELTEQTLLRISEHAPEIWDILWDVYHARMLNNLMASHSIFGKLDSASRDDIADTFELREYTAGQIIVAPEAACPAVFLILFGEIRLRPQRAEQAPGMLSEGAFFGFVASLSDEPGRVWVEATRDVTLLALPAREFRALTRAHPAVATEIRRLLRDRSPGQDLFMAGLTPYADLGVS